MNRIRKNPLPAAVAAVLLCAPGGPALAQEAADLSEKDYLGEVPIVLSVSRLPQRLDETPGAVTILDRELIRKSGVRDVADLLRLVPGFRVTSSFESNTPQGSYHTSLSDYSNHMQVLVDGRSVYSVYLQGSTGLGLQTVALEDIERIEVHRGSNSAAYGARAFLGTINIVTRDPAETVGVRAQAAAGDNQIRDGLVRYGWSGEGGNFRLTADRRADRGLEGSGGPVRVNRVNFRGDVRVDVDDMLELRVGHTGIEAGVGFADVAGNALHTRTLDTGYAQLDWRRSLGPDEDLALQVSHTEERISDHFPYTPVPGVLVDFGGKASADNLSVQHTLRTSPSLRLVWGGELRRESIVSRPVYNTAEAFVTDFVRAFANAEWRLHRDLLLNAGGLLERSSIDGTQLSPRLMLNWRVAEGHTLRYGVTRAFRPPSNYEKYSDVRYYLNGLLLDSTDVARGNVTAETIATRELGYLAELPHWNFSLDVRIFEEQVRGFIERTTYILPGSGVVNDEVADFQNDEDFDIKGFEYQLKWQPWDGGQLLFSQAIVDSTQSLSADTVPRLYRSQSLMVMQQLPAGFDVSLMYSEADATWFPADNSAQPAMSRTDVRLAKALRLGGRRGELSLVVQNLGPAYQDFVPEFRFRTQAWVMLRLEN